VDLPLWEIALRLALAAVLCGLVGLERETRGQVAGLRTHVVVGLGAALFTLVSAYGFADAQRGAGYDPSRVAAQIVSGIGFLGAGAILRQGANVRGLTTAATLWAVAALGMAVGAGGYLAAVLATAVLLVSVVLLRQIRTPVIRALRRNLVTLDLRLDPAALDAALGLLRAEGGTVRSMTSEIERGEQSVTLELRIPPGFDLQAAMRRLAAIEGVRGVGAAEVHPMLPAME